MPTEPPLSFATSRVPVIPSARNRVIPLSWLPVATMRSAVTRWRELSCPSPNPATPLPVLAVASRRARERSVPRAAALVAIPSPSLNRAAESVTRTVVEPAATIPSSSLRSAVLPVTLTPPPRLTKRRPEPPLSRASQSSAAMSPDDWKALTPSPRGLPSAVIRARWSAPVPNSRLMPESSGERTARPSMVSVPGKPSAWTAAPVPGPPDAPGSISAPGKGWPEASTETSARSPGPPPARAEPMVPRSTLSG